MTKLFFLLFAAAPFLTAVHKDRRAQGSIVLHDEKMPYVVTQFYIAGVVDERTDQSSVAQLIATNTASRPVMQSADLQGGAATAIKLFIDRNLHRDPKLRPVIMTIKTFKITESSSPGKRVSGHLAASFSFELQMDDRVVHLMDYTGGMRYDRDDRQAEAAEFALRRGIENALLAFDMWIDKQAESNSLLAKAVKVSFTDYTEKPEGDTIYYSANRPLTWDDFKDKPRDSRFEAEVFASIGYVEQNEVVNGVIIVNIEMKVDVAKSDCWVKDRSRDDYILNHEQRHFDIEKIVCEHFKRKILEMYLPVDNFYGPINVEYLETLREATRMQKQYDAETRHGQDKQAQERWNEKIDNELRELGVKK
ncbi:MAG: hypothetical protein ACXVA2_16690 [Mucilaginibacter sp.]